MIPSKTISFPDVMDVLIFWLDFCRQRYVQERIRTGICTALSQEDPRWGFEHNGQSRVTSESVAILLRNLQHGAEIVSTGHGEQAAKPCQTGAVATLSCGPHQVFRT